MSSSINEMKQSAELRRNGRNGKGWKKSNSFIEKDRERKCQEKAFIGSISRKIEEMEMRTNTPAAFMAMSDGVLVSVGSGSMKDFINDPEVIAKFHHYNSQPVKIIEDEQAKRNEQIKDAVKFDLSIPVDWKQKTKIEKMTYLRQFVKFSLGKTGEVQWTKIENHPNLNWWPQDIQFIKLNLMKLNDVDTCIDAFLRKAAAESLSMMTLPESSTAPPCSPNESTDLNLIRRINSTIDDVKKECTNSLLPFLDQIEGVTAKAREKILFESCMIDGTIMDKLSTNASAAEPAGEDCN